MSQENTVQFAFNRGIISELGLARQDIKRTSLSAETQTNWIPRVLGSMMLRPGLEYIGSTDSDNLAAHIPFVFANNDTAIIELTANKLRVRVDETIITRASVSSAITNGGFDSDITSWTDSDESGAASTWLTGGYARLLGTGTLYARLDQEITVAVGDQGVEHALDITIAHGPVQVLVGSSQGAQDYFIATLDTGVHSLALTPTGNFWIRLQSNLSYPVLVDSIEVASAGAMELTTTWDADDLALIRYTQSGDIIFAACSGQQQRKIERRASTSWSFVKYETKDGPFRNINTTATTLTPSALTGQITLTASKALFQSTHVGALFRIGSIGQKVTATITGEDQWTDPIRVTGIDAGRVFQVSTGSLTGTGTTVTLQRSVDDDSSWTDVFTLTTDYGNLSHDDTLDNQIVYYRVGVKAGDYSSGTIFVGLTYSAGSIDGIVRIVSVASATEATVNCIVDMGGTDASSYWWEGQWSDYRGWPSATVLHEGRLWWAGKDRIIGSVSDSFYSFDDLTEGDSGPINRTIGQGPVDTINWLVSSDNLIVGGEGAVKVARASSLDEPLTPTNFNLRDITTLGSAAIQALKIDTQVAFVQDGGIRIHEIMIPEGTFKYDTTELTGVVPEIGEPSIVKVVMQRKPDTRLHFIRSDGKVAILIYNKVEDVKCWILFETTGTVIDAVVLPGASEDKVYYLVQRTIDGNTKRYLEKWALESEGKGGVTNKIADSFYEYSGASVTTITGLGHLEGEDVIVWGNSKYLGEYTVASAQITGLTEAVTYAVIGIGYTADFKSTKTALKTYMGASLLQKKYINQLGVILIDTYAQGLKYGTALDANYLDELPAIENGAEVTDDSLWDQYDEEAFPFPGTWDTDARLCLRATAPKPCTILCAVASWSMHEKG